MKRSILVFTLLFAAIIGFAGKRKPVRRLVLDGTYTLISLHQNGNMKTMNPATAEISFDPTTKTAAIYLGCNRITGNLEVKSNNQVKAFIVSSTRMACPDNIEDLFKNQFTKITRVASNGNLISLYAGNKKVMILKKKETKTPSETTPLTEGHYELNSLFDGKEMRAGNYGKTKIAITSKDISCNVGCNSIRGAFKTEGNHVAPIKLTMTEMFCETVDALERQFVDMLAKTDSYRFDGATLELYNQKMLLMTFKRKDD